MTGERAVVDAPEAVALCERVTEAVWAYVNSYLDKHDMFFRNFGSPEVRFFRLAHDGGLVAPT